MVSVTGLASGKYLPDVAQQSVCRLRPLHEVEPVRSTVCKDVAVATRQQYRHLWEPLTYLLSELDACHAQSSDLDSDRPLQCS
jgi:hypothetical protein